MVCCCMMNELLAHFSLLTPDVFSFLACHGPIRKLPEDWLGEENRGGDSPLLDCKCMKFVLITEEGFWWTQILASESSKNMKDQISNYLIY